MSIITADPPRVPHLDYQSWRTNDRLDEIIKSLDEMRQWALADAEHAKENDAPGIARDDRLRARMIVKAMTILETAYR